MELGVTGGVGLPQQKPGEDSLGLKETLKFLELTCFILLLGFVKCFCLDIPKKQCKISGQNIATEPPVGHPKLVV